MTKAEAIAKLAKRLAAKQLKEIAWTDIASALSAMPPSQRAAVVANVRQNRAREAGRAVITAAHQRARELATAEATAMLANDSLDVAELERLL